MPSRIAILDDNSSMLEIMTEYITKSFKNRRIPAHVAAFGCVGDLEAATRAEAFDAYFLDVSLPGEDGIRFASSLRSQGSHAIITYVSGVDDRVFDAIRTQPIRFVRKRYLHQELSEAIRAVIGQLSEVESDRLVVTCGGTELSLRIRDMLYIESCDKQQKLVLPNRELMVRGTMKDFEDRLMPHGFIKAHRSYLINCRSIYSIDGCQMTMDNGASLPISRFRLEEVRQLFRKLVSV